MTSKCAETADAVGAFVETLLSEWESDEYQLAQEFCVGDDERAAVRAGIAEMGKRWAELWSAHLAALVS